MMKRSVVVQEHPRHRFRLLLLTSLSLLVCLVAGVLIGSFGSLELQWSMRQENSLLREQVMQQELHLEELQQWRADNQTRRGIDAAALELVRQDLASQQETIAELGRGIKFYKSLLAPGELAEGLNIRSIDVISPGEPGRYQFRILVQQSARKHQLLTGSLNVWLVGELDGQESRFELSSLSEDVPNADIRLRFKYFQAIDGEMVLPAGFIPQLVRISANSKKPRRSEVSKDIPWSVQEKISHVGQ
jgi:hypothetical protein